MSQEHPDDAEGESIGSEDSERSLEEDEPTSSDEEFVTNDEEGDEEDEENFDGRSGDDDSDVSYEDDEHYITTGYFFGRVVKDRKEGYGSWIPNARAARILEKEPENEEEAAVIDRFKRYFLPNRKEYYDRSKELQRKPKPKNNTKS